MTTEGPKWVRHDPDGGGSAPRSRAEHNSWSIQAQQDEVVTLYHIAVAAASS
jgi:hypothetical protein